MKEKKPDNSLYDTISAMQEKDFNYYNESLKFNVNDISNDYCNDFAIDYFKKGGKEYVFNDIEEFSFVIGDRMIHSTIFFFMFAHVLKVERYKNGVQEYIDKFFERDLSCECYPKDILRLLFLMCLYHDYGYIIEKRRRDEPDFKKDFNEIEELEKIKRINEKFFSKPYDLSTVKRYFEYRKYREHGISGGALLFYRLMKNFEEKVKSRNGGCFVKNIDGKEKIRKEDCFVKNNLLWCRRNDEIFYALVSSIIIKHNIWYATDFEKIEIYKENDLDSLILRDPKKRLSFKKSPLLYLFCILDTIEPVKAFYDGNDEKLSVSEILKNVEFSIDNKSIRIGVNLADKIGEEKVLKYICKIRTLQDWLSISVDYANPFKEVKLILK